MTFKYLLGLAYTLESQNPIFKLGRSKPRDDLNEEENYQMQLKKNL
jgi:hypothetical protein